MFSRHLTPLGARVVELVPDNKDPNWFEKSCATAPRCDVVIFSGHFGGLFFGESSSQTLSVKELQKARELGTCENILKAPRSVFLMGCNTLATKTPDHRSVSDYLNVLVGDGFPLSLAEGAAAARYLDFGRSMNEKMQSIFSNANYIAGFETTGPLGAQAAPLLDRTFKNSSYQDKVTYGLNMMALKNAFKATSLRVIPGKEDSLTWWQQTALNSNSRDQGQAWNIILAPQNLALSFDFLIENRDNFELQIAIVASDYREDIKAKMVSIMNQARGLTSIQMGVAQFLLAQKMISVKRFQELIRTFIEQVVHSGIDYIRASQLCEIMHANPSISLSYNTLATIEYSPFRDSIRRCQGKVATGSQSPAYKCLVNGENHDWGCLTSHASSIDIASCEMAKSRNPNAENADDMMWYCYSKMREHQKLDRTTCLQLTQGFSLLGNQIKMNWNCLNSI